MRPSYLVHDWNKSSLAIFREFVGKWSSGHAYRALSCVINKCGRTVKAEKKIKRCQVGFAARILHTGCCTCLCPEAGMERRPRKGRLKDAYRVARKLRKLWDSRVSRPLCPLPFQSGVKRILVSDFFKTSRWLGHSILPHLWPMTNWPRVSFLSSTRDIPVCTEWKPNEGVVTAIF